MPPKPRERTGDGLIPAVHGEGVLFRDPRPLVFADRPIVLSWSAKCACTHVLTWFLDQEGLLRAADYFDPWPHEFRGKVLYRSLAYRRAATRFLDSGGRGHTLVRITRDPARRLVSIFRHVVRTGFLQAELDSWLGRDTAATGLSLRELGSYLETRDLQAKDGVNVHLRPQSHAVGEMNFDRVITLNMDETPLDPGLAAIETALGLPHCPPAKAPGFEDLRERHYARDVPHSGAGPVEDARFGPGTGTDFPKRALEQAELTSALAERLYPTHYGTTGTGDSAGQLFR